MVPRRFPLATLRGHVLQRHLRGCRLRVFHVLCFLCSLGGRGLHERGAVGQGRAAEGPAREGDDGVSLAAAGEEGAQEEEVEEG